MKLVSRRMLLGIFAAVPWALAADTDPWTAADLIYPPALASQLGKPGMHIVQVGFPALYHGAHIPDSVYAGPGSKPEGLALLQKTVADLPKDANIVLYCGCCPWDKCPNVRPAFRALKQSGYTGVKLLVIPTNLHTDWIEKGYPTTKA